MYGEGNFMSSLNFVRRFREWRIADAARIEKEYADNERRMRERSEAVKRVFEERRARLTRYTELSTSKIPLSLSEQTQLGVLAGEFASARLEPHEFIY